MKILRIITLVLLAASIWFAVYSIRGGAGVGYGTLFPIALTGSLFIVVWLHKLLKRLFRKLYKPLMWVYFIGVAVYLITFAAFIISAIQYASDDLPSDVDALIILGCRAVGTVPGRSLQSRCDRAYDLLIEYPNAICIASGGVDVGNTLSEGYIMKNYLVKRGIAPERIYPEEKSTSSEENLRFSMELAEGSGIARDAVVLVTNEFHAPRAMMIANSKNINAYAATAPSPPVMLIPNYIREYFALIKSFLVDLHKT